MRECFSMSKWVMPLLLFCVACQHVDEANKKPVDTPSAPIGGGSNNPPPNENSNQGNQTPTTPSTPPTTPTPNVFACAGEGKGVQANAPWPLLRRCPNNIGTSPVNGPAGITPTTRWTKQGGDGWAVAPVIGADNTLYYGNSDNNLYAINTVDGATQWQFQTGSDVTDAAAIGVDGTIYIGADNGKVFALLNDKTSARVKWTFQADGQVKASPTIGADGTIYIATTTGKLYALKDTGTAAQQKWVFEQKDTGFDTTPALGPDSMIYIGSYDLRGGRIDQNRLFALRDNGTSVEKKWSFPPSGYPIGEIHSVPLVVSHTDGVAIYVATNSGFLHSLAAASGVQRKPPVDVAGGSGKNVRSAPALSPDGTTIYIGSDFGALFAVSIPAMTEKWVLGGRNDSENVLDKVRSSPVVGADGTIYFGCDDNRIYAVVDKGTKAERKWFYGVTTNVRSSAAIGADGTLYLGSQNHDHPEQSTMYAIKP